MNTRRRFALGLLAAAVAPLAMSQVRPAVPLRMEVWKSPTCGCCKDWIVHVQAHGFEVSVNDVGNTAARKRLGMAERYGSCHTARVAGYVVEGHVPAAEVQRLLREKPDALGLAVPGMPIGSPGMDGPEYGGQQDRYDVLLLARDGSARVYARYEGGRRRA
jgi:hypothetical protein